EEDVTQEPEPPPLVDECPDFIRKVKFESWKLLVPYWHMSDFYRERIFGAIKPDEDPEPILSDSSPAGEALENGNNPGRSRAARTLQSPTAPSSVAVDPGKVPESIEEKVAYALHLQQIAESSHFGLSLFMLAKIMSQGENYIWQLWGTVARASLAVTMYGTAPPTTSDTATIPVDEMEEQGSTSNVAASAPSTENNPTASFTRNCAVKFLLLINLLIEKNFRDPRADLQTMTYINWFDIFVEESGTVVMSSYKHP
ncbi:unnamed protein product, partial [Amoebophrya sp. A120]